LWEQSLRRLKHLKEISLETTKKPGEEWWHTKVNLGRNNSSIPPISKLDDAINTTDWQPIRKKWAPKYLHYVPYEKTNGAETEGVWHNLKPEVHLRSWLFYRFSWWSKRPVPCIS
jgi:hypothetical protein